MKRKIIAYTIGILGCIIIDAAFIALAIHIDAPVSDYILMGIFLLISDFMILGISSTYLKEESGNKCQVIKLPDAVDDDELPKLK